MPTFPKIIDLPAVLDTTGWKWTPYNTPSFPSYNFWSGIDRDGDRWLTKLRGDFYAYRELVFARLAQKMGWSCQSSTFIQLDPQSAVLLGRSAGEVHAAHWFLDEHIPETCSSDCPLKLLRIRSDLTVEDLANSRIAHLMDWPKSEIATCLFGGNELPGCLFTAEHEFVIIDSEQMFSTDPSDLTETNWWNNPDGSPSVPGQRLTREVCRDLDKLAELDLEQALRIPETICVELAWPIAPIINASRAFARKFLVDIEEA